MTNFELPNFGKFSPVGGEYFQKVGETPLVTRFPKLGSFPKTLGNAMNLAKITVFSCNRIQASSFKLPHNIQATALALCPPDVVLVMENALDGSPATHVLHDVRWYE